MKSKAQKKIQRAKSLYEKFESLVGKNRYVNEKQIIKNKINDIDDGKFRVVVAGEVSSGKSTFINALLGKDILPTGPKQTTSSIIKINNQDEKELRITYADGSESVEKDQEGWEETVADCLRDIGSIPDEYRDIPVPLLQTFRKETKDRWSDSLDALVDDIVDDSAKNQRDHGREKFKRRCSEYLEQEADLGAIPEEIEIGLPFSEEFRRLQIIDSPGVHAVGAVEDVTHEYVNQAHAILFLRKASDPAESSSFSDFVRDNVSNRSRDALFLVLTNAEKQGRRALKAKKESYQARFQEMAGIRPTNILTVDSIAEILAKEVSGNTLSSVEDQYEDDLERYDKGEASESVDPIEIESKLRILRDATRNNDNRDVAIEEIERVSGFSNVVDKLSNLEDESIYIQLEEILCRLIDVVKMYKSDLRDEIELDKAALEGSEELKSEVEERKTQIDKIRDNLARVKNNVKKRYTSREGEKRITLEDEVKKSKKSIEDAESVEEVNSEANALQSVSEEYFDTWIESIHRDIVNRVENRSDIEKPKVSLPSFEISSDRISEIKKKSKEKEVEERLCRKNKTEWKLNRYKFRKKVKKRAKRRISEKKSEAWNNYKNQATKLINIYNKILKSRLEEEKEKYNRKEAEKIEIEQREKRIKNMKNDLQIARELMKENKLFLQEFKPGSSCISVN